MRTRGFSPWYTDRPIPRPLPPTYNDVGGGADGGVIGFGMGSNIGPGFGESGNTEGRSGDGSGGAANPGSASAPGDNQQYLVLGNPFQDPGLLDSMRRQWQELPNWKSATIEGLTWEGTAEENAQKYISLVGVNSK